jgi:hypothetical protein
MTTASPEHFPGCHPEDAEAARDDGDAPKGSDVENCWHCGTPAPRGCNCAECADQADYVPASAVYHCPTCGRWWAWMMPRITTITFAGAEGEVRGVSEANREDLALEREWPES